MAGPLSRLRGMELAGRRAARPATAPRRRVIATACAGRRIGASSTATYRPRARAADIFWHRRVRSRPGRRHRARFAGAARRRAGHRQVHAAAAGGRARGAHRRSGALQLGRGVRAPNQAARRAAGRRARRRSTCSPRPASSESSKRSSALKPALVIVDSIQTIFSLRFQSAPGQHRPGARGRDAAAVRRQGRRTCRRCSSATSRRTAISPVPRRWSTSSTRCCTSKASGITRIASCAPSRTGSAPSSELGVFEMTATGLRAGAQPVAAVPCRALDRKRRARRCCAASKARGRYSSKCRRSSAAARSATPGAWPAASISSVCRCCWR